MREKGRMKRDGGRKRGRGCLHWKRLAVNYLLCEEVERGGSTKKADIARGKLSRRESGRGRERACVSGLR